MAYSELSIEERATIQVSHAQGMSMRQIARLLERAPPPSVASYDATNSLMATTVSSMPNTFGTNDGRPVAPDASCSPVANASRWSCTCYVSACLPSRSPASSDI